MRQGRRLTAALLLMAALLSGCGTDTDDTTPEPTSPETTTVAVYFMTETRAGPRLVREMRDALATDPVSAAVKLMFEGATDPDYFNPWNPAAVVLGVEVSGDSIEVDVSPEVRTANVGSGGAALMVQQLVYTATDAAGIDGNVVLLVEGEPAGELWGVLSWDEPVAREPAENVRQLVQIDSPVEGAEVSSPVTIQGEAAVFEANLPWRVLDEGGAVVESGFTMTEEGQRFAPFSFAVELEPGAYTVEIVEDDPSGGEGGPPMTDTRTITVG
ncbi:MAG TPA: Gmad2 immunoglobulin-like domain-containing protein [Nocardioidaceae bacterium]|nr:Gmad2 immunoglobulin-like domain-containing protein [Nocardioidaceae bacterium]